MGFSEKIPLFVLPFVIFPGELIALHVYEPRYKALVEHVLSKGQQAGSFGITLVQNGKLEAIGCSVMIERVLERYEDGRFDIQVRGMIRYLLRIYDGATAEYPQATVDYFEDLELKPDHSLRSKAVSLHIKLVELASDQTHTPTFGADDRASFALAHSAGFDAAQRQQFLEMRSEKERLTHLIEHYRRVIPVIQNRQDIKERVTLNGHIRKFKEEKF
jgi:ATP-dependent Lon protease